MITALSISWADFVNIILLGIMMIQDLRTKEVSILLLGAIFATGIYYRSLSLPISRSWIFAYIIFSIIFPSIIGILKLWSAGDALAMMGLGLSLSVTGNGFMFFLTMVIWEMLNIKYRQNKDKESDEKLMIPFFPVLVSAYAIVSVVT